MGSVWGVFDAFIAQDTNFALYRMPREGDIHLVLQLPETELITFSDFPKLSGYGFLMAPFQVGDTKPIVLIQPDVELTGVEAITSYAKSLCKSLPQQLRQKREEVEPVNSGTQEHYRKAYAIFHRVLGKGHFSKLVLSRTKDLSLTSSFSAAAAFERACVKYPNNFVFLCHTAATGTWIGSTPELLVAGSHGHWSTVALAGTQSVGVDLPEKEVQWDDKNRLEQQIVVDYIRDQLQALGIVPEVKPVHTVRSGGVVHLKSEIVFDLPEHVSVGWLLKQLHPTPAVCGRPKKEAIDFIVAHEGYDRQYYSGFCGIFNPDGQTNLFVNLRCAQIFPEVIRLYAGGGLLLSSNIDSEWQEAESKLQTMLSIL